MNIVVMLVFLLVGAAPQDTKFILIPTPTQEVCTKIGDKIFKQAQELLMMGVITDIYGSCEETDLNNITKETEGSI